MSVPARSAIDDPAIDDHATFDNSRGSSTAPIVEEAEAVPATHSSSPRAQDFLAERRERLLAEQRANNLSKGLMLAFGLVVLAAIGTFLLMAGTGNDEAAEPGAAVPASLAFDGLAADGQLAGDISAAGFDPHGGHDHSAIEARPHYSDDYGLTKLGGEVPEIIQQNLQLPNDSEVIHVIVQREGVWEFEGVHVDGGSFWKIVDLNQGLIYDGGREAGAEPFPQTFD